MRIGITAPTGNIGRKVVKQLLDTGRHDLVLLARDPDKLAQEQRRGAKVEHGDLADQDFVVGALKGVQSLFWLIPPNEQAPDLRTYQDIIARIGATAAKANNIGHVVLLSSIGADLDEGTGPILGLHDAELIFRGQTPSLTILRPASFMENYLFQVDAIRQAGSIFMPVNGRKRIPMIATEDIAKAVVRALTSKPEPGVHVETLVGPRDYSFEEAANIIGQTLGQPVRHVQVSDDDAREHFLQAGSSLDVAERMVEMYQSFERGSLAMEATPADAVTMPMSFEQFAQQVLRPAIDSQA